jgi:hypothetical protein
MRQYIDTIKQANELLLVRLHRLSQSGFTKTLFITGASVMLVPVGTFAWWQNNKNTSSTRPSVSQDAQIQSISNDEPLKTVVDVKQSSSADSFKTNTSIKKETGVSETELHVNGSEIPVPNRGTVHKEIRSQGGKTRIDFSSNARTSGSSRSNTSTNIELNSTTESSIDNSE